MNICFLAGTLARGGAEKQLVFMLRALRRTNARLRVLSLTRGEAYEKEIRELNIPVEWIGKARNRGRRVYEILRAVQRNPPDIFQSSHFYTNIYVGLAGKILARHTIGAVRSDLTYELQSHQMLGRWQISLPKFLITNSALAYRRVIERGIAPRKVEIVKNVVDAQNRQNRAEIRQKELRILFVGRLDVNKRADKFIDLADRLLRKMPEKPLKFQIAGDGVLRENLEKQAAACGLTREKLEFSGVCENMPEVYERADLLVSTSASEGTPNVILEAMAHGLPIAATDVGDVGELLQNRRGLAVAPNDEKSLTHAVELLINRADLRAEFGANGRKYVLENHSIESLQTRLEQIYGKILSDSRT